MIPPGEGAAAPPALATPMLAFALAFSGDEDAGAPGALVSRAALALASLAFALLASRLSGQSAIEGFELIIG